MRKNKVYRSLGNLLLTKGIIGCITSVPIFFLIEIVLTCSPGSWCGGVPTYMKILDIITVLVFVIVNISLIITGKNMRRATLSKEELDEKTGAATTMVTLAVIVGAIWLFGSGMWSIIQVILWFSLDLFLSIAVLISCMGYHKQINSKK